MAFRVGRESGAASGRTEKISLALMDGLMRRGFGIDRHAAHLVLFRMRRRERARTMCMVLGLPTMYDRVRVKVSFAGHPMAFPFDLYFVPLPSMRTFFFAFSVRIPRKGTRAWAFR